MCAEWEEITYPISMEYRKHWTTWEAVREIVQNALDSSKSTTKIERINGNLVISDKGSGLEVKHLLFGVSEKSSESRGKFGEGLKIALIVLKRLGFTAEILSNDLEIKVSTTEIEGTKCLKILYKHNGQYFQGTRVTILGYTGPSYLENFILSDSPISKLFSSRDYGELIEIEEGQTGRLFVKDIYVCDLRNSAFSYNLIGVNLEESRNVADEFSLYYEMGKLWRNLANKELWSKLFKAIESKKYEAKVNISYPLSERVKTVVKEVFTEDYPDSVIYTDEEWEREATWRNKKVVKFLSPSDHSEIISQLPTDKSFVLSDNIETDVEIEDSRLTPEELHNLEIARTAVKKIIPDCTVKVFLMSDGVLGKAGNPIKIRKDILLDRQKIVSTIIHELTHNYYECKDLTADMLRLIGDMAAKLLTTYLFNEFSTKVLASPVKNGNYQYRVSIPMKLAQRNYIHQGSNVIVTIQGDN